MIKVFNLLIKFSTQVQLKIKGFFENLYLKHPLMFILVLIFITYSSIINNDIFIASIYLSLVIIFISMFIFFKEQLRNKNSSDLDSYERVVRTAGVLSLGFLSITIIMINIGKFAIPKILHVGSVDSWIQFSGSILGGTLTLFALAITLNENENQRKEDIKRREQEDKKAELSRIETLEFNNPPVLQIRLNRSFYIVQNEKYTKNIYNNFPEKKEFSFNIYLELFNTSSSSITSTEIIDFKISKYNAFSSGIFNNSNKEIIENIFDSNKTNDYLIENELIPPNNSVFFDIPYKFNIEEINEYDELPAEFIASKIQLIYKSVLLKKIYQLEFSFSFYITKIENKNINMDAELYQINIFNLSNKYKLPKF